MLNKIQDPIWAGIQNSILSRPQEEELISSDFSTLFSSSYALPADGVTAATLTFTGKDALNAAVAGLTPVFSVSNKLVSAALSLVTASPLTISNDGVQSSTITIRCLNTEGNPIVRMPASFVVVSVSGIGNDVTQPTGFTDINGEITASFTSTDFGTKVITVTVVNLAITDTATVEVSPDLVAFGPGPNAPTWTGETDYTAQTFDSAIPSAAPADAGGWYFLGGDRASIAEYNPVVVEYPVIATPIGTRTVLKGIWPGQRNNLNALDAVTDSWPCMNSLQSVYLKVSGTWAGTITFEISDNNGASWTPQSLTVFSGAGSTGTTTTVNGGWGPFTGATGRLVRARMSSYTSGTAVVDIGRGGSSSAVRARAGTFGANQLKWYHRELIYVSPTFDNNGNVGVKMAFFRSSDTGQNHYYNLTTDGVGNAKVSVTRQGNFGPTTTISGPADSLPRGVWNDVEYIFIGNTDGNADGTLKVWVNNVLMIDRTDIQYWAISDAHDWAYLQLDTTFGGGLFPSPSTADVWFYMAGSFNRTAP